MYNTEKHCQVLLLYPQRPWVSALGFARKYYTTQLGSRQYVKQQLQESLTRICLLQKFWRRFGFYQKSLIRKMNC